MIIDLFNPNMKKRFAIEVQETLSKVVVVEADTEHEAIEKVRNMHRFEDIVLDSGDYVDVDFISDGETDLPVTNLDDEEED